MFNKKLKQRIKTLKQRIKTLEQSLEFTEIALKKETYKRFEYERIIDDYKVALNIVKDERDTLDEKNQTLIDRNYVLFEQNQTLIDRLEGTLELVDIMKVDNNQRVTIPIISETVKMNDYFNGGLRMISKDILTLPEVKITKMKVVEVE